MSLIATATCLSSPASPNSVQRLLPLVIVLIGSLAWGNGLQFSAPEKVAAGDPIGIFLHWPADLDLPLQDLKVELNGEELPLHEFSGGLVALGVAPLGTGSEEWPLRVTLGGPEQPLVLQQVISVTADPKPVEEITLPPSAASVSTPAARDTEAEMVARVWAGALPDPLWTDSFLLPLDGRSTSGYGDARRFAPGGRVSHHQGADLAAPAGTVIRATNDGVVVIAAEFPTYPIKGGLVIIDHGAGVMSYYLHQNRVLVAEGASVRRGDPIGEVGSTGLSTGPHLHWEIRLDNRATNPLAWVDRVVP